MCATENNIKYLLMSHLVFNITITDKQGTMAGQQAPAALSANGGVSVHPNGLGLQLRMDATIRVTANELVQFQDLIRAHACADEEKMTHLAKLLCDKVPASVEFFKKVINANAQYFKNVHESLFHFAGLEITQTQAVEKFIFFWYVLRPFSPVATNEDRFTFHTIQHAFYEYAMYLQQFRVPLQVQTMVGYYSNMNQQNFQANLIQSKAIYETCLENVKASFACKEKEMSLIIKNLEDKVSELQCESLNVTEKGKRIELECENLRVHSEHMKKELQSSIEQNSMAMEQVLSSKVKAIETKAQALIASEKHAREMQKKCETYEAMNRKLTAVEADLSKSLNESRKLLQVESLRRQECETLNITLESKIVDLEAKIALMWLSPPPSSQASPTSKEVSVSTVSTTKDSFISTTTSKELKSLKAELAKTRKQVIALEEELISSNAAANVSLSLRNEMNKKDIQDSRVEDVRVLVDLCSTVTKSEKVLQVLQNYVVSSMREKADEEFPAWLVVAQSILRSICLDVGLARGILAARFYFGNSATNNNDSILSIQQTQVVANADGDKNHVFLGLLGWKVESRFRALSWLRNRVVRGFSANGKMGDVKLQSFLQHIKEQQKIGGKMTLAMGKTSPDLALEISTLEVLKRETLMLLDKESFVPVSGSVFIPTVPNSLADGVFLAVRNFALVNVCCFIALMEAGNDATKKTLLDIVFELFGVESSLHTSSSKEKNPSPMSSKTSSSSKPPSLRPETFLLAHSKITEAFSGLPTFERFSPLLNQLGACADAFQDMYAKAFMFFEAHSTLNIDLCRQKRMLTLHEHADSLLTAFWASQDLSRHSAKMNEELPSSLIGKIMAMEVLWNEENENIAAGRRDVDGLLLSLSSLHDTNEKPNINSADEASVFMNSLSYLLLNGKMLIKSAEPSPSVADVTFAYANNSSEEIIGYLCNELKGSELREFITAIQESIYSFREVRKGKQVMVEGKSSLGRILQSLSTSTMTKRAK